MPPWNPGCFALPSHPGFNPYRNARAEFMSKPRKLLLAPGQFKVFDGLRIENGTSEFKRVMILVSDVVGDGDFDLKNAAPQTQPKTKHGK